MPFGLGLLLLWCVASPGNCCELLSSCLFATTSWLVSSTEDETEIIQTPNYGTITVPIFVSFSCSL